MYADIGTHLAWASERQPVCAACDILLCRKLHSSSLYTIYHKTSLFFACVLLARISSEDPGAAIASLSLAPLSRRGGEYLLVAQIVSDRLATSLKMMIFVFLRGGGLE